MYARSRESYAAKWLGDAHREASGVARRGRVEGGNQRLARVLISFFAVGDGGYTEVLKRVDGVVGTDVLLVEEPCAQVVDDRDAREPSVEARLVAKYMRKQGNSGAGALTPNMAKPGTREHLVTNMVVDYIAQTAISAIPFPSYEQAKLSFAELKAAVSSSGWRASLNSVSAVYLVE